ncbi:hypothetical protein EGT67_09675 [Prescottella agglutinans]|uniref:Uncharacterized protein n=1 Tax=Prescottella agglutinans TaxID=1644129 RepID=A0A3S3AJG8_9NOCA|nr:hypothetical protein [Prescottella agglutinans]RVW09719.1 hypothetical protein EGT67_09675 [Prescottella agglutinans]
MGNLVRIYPDRASIFVIDGVDEADPDRFVIKPVGENAPGAYPFPMRRHELIPHQESGRDGM